MNTAKSLQRIGWRFSQGKEFKPNQSDIEAFNDLVDYYTQKSKTEIIDNELFGKMYVYLYGQFVTYYKCSPLDNIPQSELHRLLNMDYRVLIQDVTDKLNLSELENVIKKDDSIKNYEPMKYEEVAENFKTMIVTAINNFSPKHLNRIEKA